MMGAFVTAGGTFWMAIHDIFVDPMKNSHRPAAFIPVMVLTGLKLVLCLVMSTYAVVTNKKKKRNIDQHMIWIFRALITSFSQPMMRVYPFILRLIFDYDCFEENRPRAVMGAMFISQISCFVLDYIAQRYTQQKIWDTYMKLIAFVLMIATIKEVTFVLEHGTFIGGLVQCTIEKKNQSVVMWR